MTILTTQLRAMVLAIWTAHSPPLARTTDAQHIATAIAQAVVADGARAPVFGSHNEDAAAMAYWVVKESLVRVRGPNGDGGNARGPFQMHGRCGRLSLDNQARCWLWILHEGAKRCPASPSAIMWGDCHVDLAPYGFPGWDSERAADSRMIRVRELLMSVVESSLD